MQVVGLEPGPSVGFAEAADALVTPLSERGSAAVVAWDDDGIVVTRVDREMTTTYIGDDRQALGQTAIDRLADDGIDYAVVDPNLTQDAATVVIGGTDEGTLASLDPSALDGDRRLATVVDAIDELEPYETLGSLVSAIQTHHDSPKAGALATFTGRVRAENLEGARTTHLEYEKYEDVADAEMDAIRDELTDRDGVYEVLMHHNTGVVPAEADAVHVVVLAGHRAEAFRAVEDGIDLLKARVPIFKKEVTETGEHWAHDRP